ATTVAGWVLFGLLLVAGFMSTVALARIGMRHLWIKAGSDPHALRVVEGAPVVALVLACVWLAVRAETVMAYTRATAAALHAPAAYVRAVLDARPLPGPTRPDVEGAP